MAGGKSGVISLHQDVEEIPVHNELAGIDFSKEEAMDQRKKPGVVSQ